LPSAGAENATGPARARRRIVLFYKSLVTPGGAERLLVKEWLHLRRMGHDVKILTFQANEKAFFGFDDRIKDDLVICQAVTWPMKMLQAFLFLLRFKPDAIIVSSGVIETLFLSRLLPMPYVVHHHLPISMSYGDYVKFCSLLGEQFEWLCSRTPYSAE